MLFVGRFKQAGKQSEPRGTPQRLTRRAGRDVHTRTRSHQNIADTLLPSAALGLISLKFHPTSIQEAVGSQKIREMVCSEERGNKTAEIPSFSVVLVLWRSSQSNSNSVLSFGFSPKHNQTAGS